MRRIERRCSRSGWRPTARGERYFPHEFMYRDPASGSAQAALPDRSEGLAGCSPRREKNLPMFVPGWEDSTLGNMFAGHCISGDVKNVHTVRTGIEYMMSSPSGTPTDVDAANGTARSASSRSAAASPATSRSASCRCCTRICSAPSVPLWGYFCQISDSTTSYGSYSGAVRTRRSPGASSASTRRSSSSKSDASIVAPLIFAMILGW